MPVLLTSGKNPTIDFCKVLQVLVKLHCDINLLLSLYVDERTDPRAVVGLGL